MACIQDLHTNLDNKDRIQEWYQQGEEIYWNCFHETSEIMESVPFYEKCAELGYPPSILRLVCLFEKFDDDKHKKWKERCMEHKGWFLGKANSGNAEYECDMGLYYRWVEKDNAQALDWYKKSEIQNCPKAYICLIEVYREGLATKRDSTKAFEVCWKAAELGMRTAQLHVGVCYLYGDGVNKDHKEAKKWMLKTQERGLIQSAVWMGRRYKYLLKYDKAAEWYQKSVDLGDTEGMVQFALLHSKASFLDWKKQDPSKAVSLMKKAAEKGEIDAITKMAQWYYHGVNTKKNFKEAIYWLNKLLHRQKEIQQTQYMLGQCYYGLRDYQQAVYWFEIAANQKHVQAIDALARCYEFGDGVEQDLRKALSLVKDIRTWQKSTKRRLEEVTRIDACRKEEEEQVDEEQDS